MPKIEAARRSSQHATVAPSKGFGVWRTSWFRVSRKPQLVNLNTYLHRGMLITCNEVLGDVYGSSTIQCVTGIP